VLHFYLQIVIKHCIIMSIPTTELLRVAAILLKLFLVIQNNVMAIFGLSANYDAEAKVIFLGNSMNLASSLVNHSCEPNMYVVSYGTTTVFRAKRPIKKGEQLTYCYLNAAISSSYQERRDDLYESHKFNCM
jgi:SET domain